MAPIFFAYERTPLGLKKTHIALSNFNTYLERTGTTYAASSKYILDNFSFLNRQPPHFLKLTIKYQIM